MQCNRASTANGDGIIGVHGKGIVLCDLASEGGGGVYQQGVVIAREGENRGDRDGAAVMH